MPTKTTAAHAAAPKLAPIVFLNPNVVTAPMRVGMLPDQSSRGVTAGVLSLRDLPIEALAMLLGQDGASLVCTDSLVTGFDTRDHLFGRGLRGVHFGADWFAYRERAARAQAVEAWLIRHGTPPAIVIDYPPRVESEIVIGKGAVIVSINVPSGAELTADACRQALGALRNRTA